MYITFLVGQLVLAANLLANVTFYLYALYYHAIVKDTFKYI